MMMADKNNRFLYEIRPDLFPEGYLTDLELELWNRYLDWKNELSKGAK